MSKSNSGRFKGTRGSSDDGFRKVNGFTTKLHDGRQGKHIVGHNNYVKGKSILRMSLKHAQQLTERYAGTGLFIGNNKEVVDFHETIGIWISPNGKEKLPTTRGIIHYGNDGAHIVPAYPERK